MESVRRETTRALRRLARAPGFTAAAVATLGLGVGATTGTFSVANGVLLSPLPYGDADGIVAIWSAWTGFPETWVSVPEVVHYRQQSRTLADAAVYFTSAHNLTSTEDPERVGSGVVSYNLFDVLQVTPQAGRGFTREDAVQQTPVVMLAHDLWQRRYGGDPGVVGNEIPVNGLPFTVVGILPAGFRLPVDFRSPSPSEVYFALPVDLDDVMPVPENGGNHGYYAAGRLNPGVTVDDARADLTALTQRLEAEGVYRASWSFRPIVRSVADDVAGNAKDVIILLLAACGLVLLIACGNVANLLLSRSEGRRQDLAVLRALGASRRRILAEVMTEAVVLAGAGGILGWFLAWGGVELFKALNPGAIPRAELVAADGGVAAFALAVTGLTVLLFGWLPASRAARKATGEVARGSRRHGESSRTQRLLVAAQMAMAVVLLVASGLMVRTLVSLMDVDTGLDADNVLTLALTTPSATYPDEAAVSGFYDELLRRLEELPGVRSAGAIRLLPLATQIGDAGVRVAGYTSREGETMTAEWQWATPAYHEIMGIPIVRGRTFTAGDAADAPAVIVINEALARRYWGENDPIGGRIATIGGDTATVIGVVGDVQHNELGLAPKERFYRPLAQVQGTGTIRRMTLAIKTASAPEGLINPVRQVIREMDPTMPVAEVRTMEEVMAVSVAQPRFASALLASFSAVAMLLATLGIYGVLAYSVSRRTREIGVRMALGADRTTVVRGVVRDGLTMALAGVMLGVVLALAFSSLLRNMLYEVAPTDALTFLVVPSAFMAVAALACWIPARGASRIPPSTALRQE